MYHIHQDKISKDAQRVSKYTPYLNDYDWSKIKFPVPYEHMYKVEELIDYGINVWGYENNKPFQLYTSKRQDKIINLLLIGEHVNKCSVKHYVYIKKLDVFVYPKQKDGEGKSRYSKRHVCVYCLHGFTTKQLLDNHIENGCDKFEPTRCVLPKCIKNDDGTYSKPTIEFKNHARRFKFPVVIYADFETLIQKTNNIHDSSKSSTTKIADLPPCGYSFNIVSDYLELNFGLKLYRGDDVATHFIDNLLHYGDKIRKILDDNKDMIITEEQQENHINCKECHICKKPIKEGEITHRDHDHITGKYIGCAHSGCNQNRNFGRKDGKNKKKEHYIPVFFHNLKGFDGHLIIQALKERNFSNI